MASTRFLSNYIIRLAIPIAVMTIGCTPSTQQSGSFINRLKNRGPVALSSENPFLAANLLVAREMERSPDIRGFIETRGAPLAVEIEKPVFAALTMLFYYPEQREFYTLEEEKGQWIIRGPNTISRENMKEVARVTHDTKGEPKLNVRVTGGPFQSYAKNEAPKTEAASANSPSPKIDTKSVVKAAPAAEESLMQLIAQIESHGGSEAETTPKGDLVHYVTYPGETLSMIARWYTHDRANVGRLTRTNKISDPNNLKAGDLVVVPSYLVKNKIRLSEEIIKQLSIRAGNTI